MPVTNFTCNKDARIARRESDNYDSGAGTGSGLAYGLYSGYRYRALLGFSINFAGWTSITSAVLNYKSSNQINVAFGSDPTMLVQRLSAAWSEGSAASLSSSNAVIFPGPGAYSTNQVEEDAPTGENTWGAVDITAMMRDAMAAGVFHGVRILGSTNTPGESDSSANVGEIYSRESGSGTAYITINYETNRAPDAPSISSPDVANGGLVGTQTPALHVYMTDPDGNAINNYHWQIDDNADFSSPIQDVYPGAAGASGVTAVVVPAALPRGGTYYFRAQAADVSVWGGWSGTFSFKVAGYPTTTLSEPSASGRLARLTYDPGAGWGSPRMVVNWAMTCPDGGTQATWRLEVYNDSAGALGSVVEDITVNDTQSSRIVPANLIEGNYYHVRVQATCSHGLLHATPVLRVRARWGAAVYMGDMGAVPIGSLALTTLDVTDETTGGQGRVVMEYQTTAAATPPSVWASTIGGAGLNRYFWYAVYLLSWGASPAVSPTLNGITITYTTSVIVPDKWAINDSANQAGDVSSYVYGTKSLRMRGKGIGNGHAVQQVLAVVPNTKYIVSGRVQTSGDGKGRIDLLLGGATQTTTPSQVADIEFEDPRSRLVSGIWDSGNNTSVTIRCIAEGAVGTTCWFDAIKMEASTVVTPWSPGYIANAVVLDSGGLQIDGSQGGIFRLKGGSGGARDLVELGGRGLMFGDASAELYSGGASMLNMTSHLTTAGFVASGQGVSAVQDITGQAAVIAQGRVAGAYGLSGNGASGVMRINGNAASGTNWGKILSGTIPGQYWQHQMHGYIITRYGVSEISTVIHADAGPAAQPSVSGNIRVLTDNSGLAIATARVVVKSVNPIVYELWVQIVSGYAFFEWYPDIITGEGSYPVIENPGVSGWASNPPAGTAYNLRSQSMYDGYMMQGGTANPNTDAFVTVTFSPAFSGVPIVAAWPLNFNWYCGSNGTAPTASSFIVGVKRPGQAGGAGCPVQWLAWGPR